MAKSTNERKMSIGILRKLDKSFCEFDITRSKQWVLWQIQRLLSENKIAEANVLISKHLTRYEKELKDAGDYTPAIVG